MKKFFARIRKAFFYPYIRETENAAGKMPRECGEIAQERRAGEMGKKIEAKRESAHRKPQRATEERRPGEPERLGQRHSRKADSQLEQIEEGSAAGEDQRSRHREKERQRERTAGEMERMPSS